MLRRPEQSAGRQAAEELDASDCGLDDSDVYGLMEVVRSCPCLAVLDLRCGRRTHLHASPVGLAGVLIDYPWGKPVLNHVAARHKYHRVGVNSAY